MAPWGARNISALAEYRKNDPVAENGVGDVLGAGHRISLVVGDEVIVTYSAKIYNVFSSTCSPSPSVFSTARWVNTYVCYKLADQVYCCKG